MLMTPADRDRAEKRILDKDKERRIKNKDCISCGVGKCRVTFCEKCLKLDYQTRLSMLFKR